MRLASWVAVGVVAFGFATSANAQTSGSPQALTPSNLSSVMTGVKPSDVQFRMPDGRLLPKGAVPTSPTAATATRSRFSLASLFARLTGSSNSGPSTPTAFKPVMPVMSTVDNPGKAISIYGSASGIRGSSFQLPRPISGQ